jgi:hypothetical protein
MTNFEMELTERLCDMLFCEFEEDTLMLSTLFYKDDEVCCEKLEAWIEDALSLTHVNKWLKDEILERVDLSCLIQEIERMMRNNK